MNKKANTVIFMILATLINVLLLGFFFLLGFLLLNLYLSNNPESTTAPLWIGVVFLVSIALSFFTYSKLVSFAVKKFDLESKMEPLFGGKKKVRKPKEE